MRNCNEYQEMISRLLDEELSAEEAQALHAHMRECDECRRMCDAFSTLSASIAGDMEEPPAELAAGVMFKVRAAAAAPNKRRFKIGHYAALAACLAIVILAGAQSNLFGSKMKMAPESASMEIFDAQSLTADSAVPLPAPEPKGVADAPEASEAPREMYDGGIAYSVEAESCDDGCEITEEADTEETDLAFSEPENSSLMLPEGMPETLTYEGQTYRYAGGAVGLPTAAMSVGTVGTLFPDAASDFDLAEQSDVFSVDNAFYISCKPDAYLVYQLQ